MDGQDGQDLITEGGHSCLPRREAGPPKIWVNSHEKAQKAQRGGEEEEAPKGANYELGIRNFAPFVMVCVQSESDKTC